MKLTKEIKKDIELMASQYKQEFLDREIAFEDDEIEFQKEISRADRILEAFK